MSQNCVSEQTEKYNMTLFYNLQKQGQLAVINWCMDKGLISKRYECPSCGKDMKLKPHYRATSDGYSWACTHYSPKKTYKKSVREGSVFNQVRVGIIKALLLLYLLVKRCSAYFICFELEININTFTNWKKFCQTLYIDACVCENTNLGGQGVTVEIECLHFKGKYLKENERKNMWVFGGVENCSNKYFFEVCEGREKKDLLKVINKRILPGSTVISQLWKGYNHDAEDSDNFSVTYNVVYDKNGVKKLLWNSIKKSLCETKWTPNNFDVYIAEFMWRRLHGSNQHTLFPSFMKGIINCYPPKFKDGDKSSSSKWLEFSSSSYVSGPERKKGKYMN